MSLLRPVARFASLLIFGLLACSQAHAQATRTWVSGVGDDANPCSRTAPCKTFAGSISKTAAGGVIDVLDPGGFGAVTITKSITLENDGAIGSILVSGTNGMVINGNAVVVTLRGLSFEGLGLTGSPGLTGIKFFNGKKLIVEHCDIGNFGVGALGNAGIVFAPSTAATLVVRDTTFHNNGAAINVSPGDDPTTYQSAGILIAPTASGSVTAVLDNVRVIDGLGNGLQVYGPATVAVRDSVIAGNGNQGIYAIGINNGSASVDGTVNMDLHGVFVSNNALNGIVLQGVNYSTDASLDDVTVSGNPQSGVFAQGAHAKVVLSGSTITGSVQGLRVNSGASAVSFGNNRLFGNTVNGAPTATSALQ